MARITEQFRVPVALDAVGMRLVFAPAPRHVEGLVELGRAQDAVLVIAATWDHLDGAQRVAEKIGTAMAVLPASSLAVEAAGGYLDLFEVICDQLEKAAGGGS